MIYNLCWKGRKMLNSFDIANYWSVYYLFLVLYTEFYFSVHRFILNTMINSWLLILTCFNQILSFFFLWEPHCPIISQRQLLWSFDITPLVLFAYFPAQHDVPAFSHTSSDPDLKPVMFSRRISSFTWKWYLEKLRGQYYYVVIASRSF